jgi:hypothetical protein
LLRAFRETLERAVDFSYSASFAIQEAFGRLFAHAKKSMPPDQGLPAGSSSIFNSILNLLLPEMLGRIDKLFFCSAENINHFYS